MKIRMILLGLLVTTGIAFPQKGKVIKGKSQFKQLFEEKENVVKTLPDLVILDQTFTDANSNRIIDAGEAGSIIFKIRNDGEGPADDVQVKVLLDKEPFQGLSFSKLLKVGTLLPHETREVSIPVIGGTDLITGQVVFSFEVLETKGFDAFPSPMKINTHKLRSPEVFIADAAFIAEDGQMIRLAEEIILRVLVQNIGDDVAESVSVKFDFMKEKENCFIMGEDGKIIGSLKPGEYEEVEFKFTANTRYSLNEIPIFVDITEGMREYDRDTTLIASLDQEIHSGQLIAIEGIDKDPGGIVLGELEVDERVQEAGVTMRGVGDPLKGLNLDKAKKDMVIGDYYALIIGIDDYFGSFEPLNNAVRDAETIEQLLKSKYKFDHFVALYDRQATKREIILAFEDLTRKVTENDNVFIYYSGHGDYKEQFNRGFWVPVDARSNSMSELISNNDITTLLSGIKSKHTLLVSDACFSGDILRGDVMVIPFEESERYYREVHDRPSRKAITSGEIEPVMDGGKDGHSVFAYYFIRTLRDNDSMFYDASQLYDRIKIPVANNSEQRPRFSPLKNTGDEGGQFIFIQRF